MAEPVRIADVGLERHDVLDGWLIGWNVDCRQAHRLLGVTNREWVSVALWIVALGMWVAAGIWGDLPVWLVVIVVAAFSLQVANAVRLALKQRA